MNYSKSLKTRGRPKNHNSILFIISGDITTVKFSWDILCLYTYYIPRVPQFSQYARSIWNQDNIGNITLLRSLWSRTRIQHHPIYKSSGTLGTNMISSTFIYSASMYNNYYDIFFSSFFFHSVSTSTTHVSMRIVFFIEKPFTVWSLR